MEVSRLVTLLLLPETFFFLLRQLAHRRPHIHVNLGVFTYEDNPAAAWVPE